MPTRYQQRAHEPIQCIEVGEDPTTCIYCGTRTELDAIEADFWDSRRPDAPVRENCPHCGQRYLVEDEALGPDDADSE